MAELSRFLKTMAEVVAAHEAAPFARDKMSEEGQAEIRNRIADLPKWILRGR